MPAAHLPERHGRLLTVRPAPNSTTGGIWGHCTEGENSNSFEPPLLQRPRTAPGEKQQLVAPPGQAARCHLLARKAERREGLPWQVKRELNMLRRQQGGNSFASTNNARGRLS